MSSRYLWTGRVEARPRGWWLLLPVLLLSACEEQQGQAPSAAPPPAVSVVEVEPQAVTPSVQFVGRVVAIDHVDLRARVEGFLEQRLFTEGDDVEEGELLFVIEQPPFEAQVAQAQADVARAEASVAETQATLERVQQASGSGAVSKQEVDQATANDQRAQAEVLSAKAQLQIAQLNLSYTEIHAPISGRIGLANYTVGNLVGPDSGVLATIVNQDPIYVTFPVSTRTILNVKEQAARSGNPVEVVVRAQLPDGTMYGHPGKVNFLNIQVDETTDTISVRAQFPNPNGFLVDGQFVNVTVEQENPEERLVVPQAALQIDQAGSYVLVVNDQDEVEQQRIETGQSYGADVVAQSGLKAGDRVIVDGVQKVRPGQKVQASVVPMTPIQSGAPVAPAGQTPAASTGASTGQPAGAGAAAPAGQDAATPASASQDGAASASTPAGADATQGSDQAAPATSN